MKKGIEDLIRCFFITLSIFFNIVRLGLMHLFLPGPISLLFFGSAVKKNSSSFDNFFSEYNFHELFEFALLGLGCKVKENCPHVGPGLTWEVPSMGIFLKDSSLHLCEFRWIPRKTPKAKSTSAKEDWTWHLPSISFEGRIARLLAGPFCYIRIFSPNWNYNFITKHYNLRI